MDQRVDDGGAVLGHRRRCRLRHFEVTKGGNVFCAAAGTQFIVVARRGQVEHAGGVRGARVARRQRLFVARFSGREWWRPLLLVRSGLGQHLARARRVQAWR